MQSIAIEKNDNVWLALNEKVNEACLAKIANGQWTLYTSDVLGFQPYYFGNIQFDSKNSLCGAIDYSLSGTAYNDGAQVFIFDGKTARSLEFDNSKDVKFVTVDKHDNILFHFAVALTFKDEPRPLARWLGHSVSLNIA